MGPTDPNRLWEEGGNDPQGKAGGPVLETGARARPDLESAPSCSNAGISSSSTSRRQHLDVTNVSSTSGQFHSCSADR